MPQPTHTTIFSHEKTCPPLYVASEPAPHFLHPNSLQLPLPRFLRKPVYLVDDNSVSAPLCVLPPLLHLMIHFH